MKQTLLFVALLSWLSLAIALSSVGLGPIFTIDTKAPQVELHSPAGGDILYIGDSHEILWTAADANLLADDIDLDFSLSGGTYTPLATSIQNSGAYLWEIPSQQSTSARLRLTARDSFGNIGIASSEAFVISYVPPATPTGINVEITDENHAYITWEAVSHTIPPYNTPITPDGYIVLYNESPYEHDEHFYYFLGHSLTTSYTHHEVARFREQMFYRVIAYKNLRAEEEAALAALERESKERAITWREAKNTLKGVAK